MNEVEYHQAVAAELQQGFANSLAQQAANYEGQLAMLKVQAKAQIEQLQSELEQYKPAEDEPEVAPVAPAAKTAKK